ncbi:MAG TPA: TolC family protein, partial [Planctomycetaceae bacterium]|nr:TolC family protein [Planctomycetaceae bacterium]
LPPDDPAAHEFMHWAYGRRGYKHWHEFGDQFSVDNPHWLEPFGLSQEFVEASTGRPLVMPEVKITMEDMIDLAYIHVRDYQTQIENLYSAALALTAQRFAFDVQFTGLGIGTRPTTTTTYTDIPSTSDAVNINSNVGVTQLLPTGAQWLVQLANNTLWLFASGNKTDSTASTLTYSLVQPLLANGGRRFVMENLTQAERNLLYAVRDLQRYRMGFFTSIVAGGFTAGIATGQPGVFLGGPTIPTPVPQIGSGGNGGYLALLQNYQSIANTEFQIRQIRDQLDRLRAQAAERPDQFSQPLAALPAGVVIPDVLADRIAYDAAQQQLNLRGQLTDLEVNLLLEQSNDPAFQKAVIDLHDSSNILTTTQSIVQLETQLAQTVQTLRAAKVTYFNGFDNLKLWLGLPVDMPVSIDTSMLKPFEIVDQRLIRLQDRLNAFILEPPPVSEEHPDAAAMQRVYDLMRQFNADEPDLAIMRALVDEMSIIRDDLKRDGLDVTEDDFRRATEHRANTTPFQNDFPIQTRRDPKRDERLKETLLAEFRESEAQLDKLKQELAMPDLDTDALRKALGTLADLREDFVRISQNFTVIQVNLRVDLIDLNPWDMSMEDAVATGLANRLDLMNARATVMDLRRKVEVAANQLLAMVNVIATGNIQTLPLGSGNENPFDFRGKDSSFQVGLQFTTPIQLVNQRNAYRAALIGYQQGRRNYQRTEDQVKLDIRQRVRFLDQTRRNFETIRDQIRGAMAQFDIAAEQTAAPAAPGAPAGAGQPQGLQILQAVNSVLQAQNNLITQWVGFEAFRLDVYNFMGIMEIDKEGYWTDEFYQARARIHRANPNRLYPPVQGQYAEPPAAPPANSQQLNDETYAQRTLPKAAPAKPPAPSPAESQEPPGRIRLASAEAPAAPAKSNPAPLIKTIPAPPAKPIPAPLATAITAPPAKTTPAPRAAEPAKRKKRQPPTVHSKQATPVNPDEGGRAQVQ